MEGSTILLFGGTGNLAYKKLYPAIYQLYYDARIKENFRVIAIGRRDYTDLSFHKVVEEKIKAYSQLYDAEIFKKFSSKIEYMKMDIENPRDYKALGNKIEDCKVFCSFSDNRLFYLATAPRFFKRISENLKKAGILDIDKKSYKRIVIEKPFGKDLEDARDINKAIAKIFDENEIYRTDHYLGKSMIQNIMILRFSNTIFEPLWHQECIDNIQITVSESEGIEERGGYYEKAGALRDMIQNHLIQILALVAMEVPKSLQTEDIRDEKVKVLKALRLFDARDMVDSLVLGQYHGGEGILAYRDEKNVDKESLTESYVALKVSIDNPRWQGVDFYLRTGKRLKAKSAQIVIQFKDKKEFVLYDYDPQSLQSLKPNLLTIKIQPSEGMSLGFNLKEPSTLASIQNNVMDFCQNCNVKMKSPEAYEKLILDALMGDQSLFTRWDEVEAAWTFVDKISNSCMDRKELIKFYQPGSWGPKAAEDLLVRHGLKWWTN